ncbi:MAG: S8 family serine peptidase [Oscillospiraceae bacterium]|nr:S8 family serine peptidase [Oscillospiraceae bacterium]
MNKRILAFFLTLCIVFPGSGFAANIQNSTNDENWDHRPPLNGEFESSAPFAPDRVIVKTKASGMSMAASSVDGEDQYDFGGLEIEEVKSLDMNPSRRSGGVQRASQNTSQTLLLKLKNTGERSVAEAVELLNSLPNIEIAEPDYILAADYIPNDPYCDQLYGMEKISAPDVWDLKIDCSSIVVAVIDTGIDINHPDLAANIWKNTDEVLDGTDSDGNGFVDDICGWNFVDDNNNPFDDNGHGTHVAGTIGAVGDNGIGVAGVAWNVKLVPLKTLDYTGYGNVSNSIRAVNYAAMMGFPITNNSYGGEEYSEIFLQAIENCNGIFVAAAGNDYGTNNDIAPHYPSNYDCANVISVASTDFSDSLSGFSNYGPNTVHIAAPGSNILSTYPGNDYITMNGTSMAAPHVTGAAAVIMASNPALTIDEIIAQIVWNSDEIPSLENRTISGGRLNAYKALTPVTFVPVEDIALSNSSMDVRKRESLAIKATISPSNATNKRVRFSSNNPAVASVTSSGMVTGIADGTAVVTAVSMYDSTIRADCVITVSGELPQVNFTDMVFKQVVISALQQLFMSMPGEDPRKYIDYTLESEIYPDDVQKLPKLSMSHRNIENLDGIEYFTNLVLLECLGNSISEIDVSMLPSLTTLICSDNMLANLDFDPENDWETMIIDHNYLNVSPGSTLRDKLDIVEQKAAICQYTPQLTYVHTNGITLSDTVISMNKRELRTIKAEVTPSNATNKKVNWKSSNEDVAVVSKDGVITAKSDGSIVITAISAENPSITADCIVNVSFVAMPIVFKDMVFKQEVVDHLKRRSSLYAGYTSNSDIYPDDLAIIESLGIYNNNVTDMSELSYFSTLENLILYNANMKELDLSQLTSLSKVTVGNSPIEHFNASNLVNLSIVSISGTMLEGINLSGSINIENLILINNNLQSIDLTGLSKLYRLDCHGNHLSILDVSQADRLEYLDCRGNNIKSLDVSGHTSLIILYCQNNDLMYLGLGVSNRWSELSCENNYLDLTPGSAFMQAIDVIKLKILYPSHFTYTPQRIPPLLPPLVVFPASLELIDSPVGYLTATVNVDIGDKTVLWSSYDTDVVTVNQSGVVTAVKSGSTMIRAELAQNSSIFIEVPVTVVKTVSVTYPLKAYEPVTLTQTGDVVHNNVQYQTAAAVIAALPSQIDVTVDDGYDTVVSVPVTWADTDGYNASTAGDYIFTAAWGVLPVGVNNDDNLPAPICTVNVAMGLLAIIAPPISSGTYGDSLLSMELTGGESIVPGSFSWDETDPDSIYPTVVATSAYKVKFTPENQDFSAVTDIIVTPTMDRKTITVEVSPAAKIYGQPNPIFTADCDSLVGSDTVDDLGLALVSVATDRSSVGFYDVISSTGLGNNGNYSVTVDGKDRLAVSKKPIKVWADMQTRGYGEPNPLLTFSLRDSFEDLVGDDTANDLAVTLICDINENANAGFYYNVIYGVSNSVNYDVTIEPGVLIISKINQTTPVTATLSSDTAVMGQTPPTVITSGGDGDGAFTFTSSNESVARIDLVTGVITLVGAGVTGISAMRGEGTNHLASSLAGTATLTVAAATAPETGVKVNNAGNTGDGSADGAQTIPDDVPPLDDLLSLDVPFIDVKDDDWYYDSVIFAYKQGLMVGTSANEFSPNTPITRGMFVTVLYRMEGLPDISGLMNPFDDVSDEKYYADAVKWAAANEIVYGYGNGNFGPEDNISRQDVVAIFYRFAIYSGVELPVTRTNVNFIDEADIADYAKEAIVAFFRGGIINGKPGNLFDPKGNATRAEIATMLTLFLEQ